MRDTCKKTRERNDCAKEKNFRQFLRSGFLKKFFHGTPSLIILAY